MKTKATIATLVAACASTVLGKAQLINGNWYDSAVERIVFTDWGQAGTYSKVTDMSNGECEKEEVSFSGGMSPLDGEVSFAPVTSCRVVLIRTVRYHGTSEVRCISSSLPSIHPEAVA